MTDGIDGLRRIGGTDGSGWLSGKGANYLFVGGATNGCRGFFARFW